MLLVLIGLRGSGKTTIGRAVASRLNVAFVDLDDLTTAAMRASSVSDAFSRGQAEFRAAEVGALRGAVERDGVLALGGGTPTAPGAADMLKSAQRAGARIVYLRASAATLRHRLQDQMQDRPSLTGADPLVEIEVVLAKREPLYLELADEVVNVDGLSLDAVVERVAASF